MTAKLDNAMALYLEGIRNGRAAEAMEAYTGDRYTQHSTGVRDGQEGFLEFFTEFVERNPEREIEIVRGIEDGDRVFLHVTQHLNGGEARWVTMDMFEFDDDDRIVEHWDVISEWVDDTVSGHGQVDGPVEVGELDRTEENKALVAGFVDEVLVHGRGDRIDDFVSSESYVQHNPQVADGIEGIAAFVQALAEAGTPLVYKYVHTIMGQGNFVVSFALAQIGDEDHAVFDLFRVDDGRIVEHWDAMEPLPRGDQLVNRGKF